MILHFQQTVNNAKVQGIYLYMFYQIHSPEIFYSNDVIMGQRIFCFLLNHFKVSKTFKRIPCLLLRLQKIPTQ